MRPIAGFRTNRRSSGEALTRAGAGVALPLLLRVIERVREREASEPASRAGGVDKVRGARACRAGRPRKPHRALRSARVDRSRGIAAAGGVPGRAVDGGRRLVPGSDGGRLRAIDADGRCQRTRSRARKAIWWRDHLADVFRIIVRRERLTRRHAVVKKIEKRWGSALEDLWAGGAGKAGGAGTGR